jgi:hypothetical protein
VSSIRRREDVVRLHEGSDGRVVLTTADSDRFISTQRDIVNAMRGADDILAKSRDAAERFNQMVRDIQAWSARQPQVKEVILSPRADDVLVVVVSNDEDEEGSLDDAISELDLDMFSGNRFRLSWLMLRASEAAGTRVFVDADSAKCIYDAG